MKTEQIDNETLKEILKWEIEKEGLDHRDFWIKITNNKPYRRKGTCYGTVFNPVHVHRTGAYSEKGYVYVILHEPKHNSLMDLIKTFRHELLHARGIAHKDFLHDRFLGGEK